MNLLELSVLYVVVGGGCAIALLVRRGFGGRNLADAVLLLPLWPLYGPFLLRGSDPAAPREAPDSPFLDALSRARGTPLASLLPDEDTAQALAARVQVAGSKIAEIDRLLEQPGFSEAVAMARQDELTAAGNERAAQMAASRLQNIRRLRGLRERFARELAEVGELLAQLRIQAELVRLSGTQEVDPRGLITELVSRVEGLDAIFDDDSADLGAP